MHMWLWFVQRLFLFYYYFHFTKWIMSLDLPDAAWIKNVKIQNNATQPMISLNSILNKLMDMIVCIGAGNHTGFLFIYFYLTLFIINIILTTVVDHMCALWLVDWPISNVFNNNKCFCLRRSRGRDIWDNFLMTHHKLHYLFSFNCHC